MTRTMWRVLLALVAQAEPGNYLYFSPAELARRSKIDYRSCLACWKMLQIKGWMTDVYVQGHLMGYRLSAQLGWRGRPWKALGMTQQRIAEQRLDALAATLEE